eukprot:scaffold7771_cov23-Tisochrysis_lutea.AAC.1
MKSGKGAKVCRRRSTSAPSAPVQLCLRSQHILRLWPEARATSSLAQVPSPFPVRSPPHPH